VGTFDKEERAIGSTPEGAITKSNQKGTGGQAKTEENLNLFF